MYNKGYKRGIIFNRMVQIGCGILLVISLLASITSYSKQKDPITLGYFLIPFIILFPLLLYIEYKARNIWIYYLNLFKTKVVLHYKNPEKIITIPYNDIKKISWDNKLMCNKIISNGEFVLFKGQKPGVFPLLLVDRDIQDELLLKINKYRKT